MNGERKGVSKAIFFYLIERIGEEVATSFPKIIIYMS